MSQDTAHQHAAHEERLRLFWSVLVRQLLLLLLFTWLVAGWQTREQAIIAFVGGSIALVAQTLAGLRGLIRIDQRSARHLLAGVLRGEVTKWVVVVAAFVLVFRLRPEWQAGSMAIWLFAGFIVVQVVAWWSVVLQEAIRAAKTTSTINEDR